MIAAAFRECNSNVTLPMPNDDTITKPILLCVGKVFDTAASAVDGVGISR